MHFKLPSHYNRTFMESSDILEITAKYPLSYAVYYKRRTFNNIYLDALYLKNGDAHNKKAFGNRSTLIEQNKRTVSVSQRNSCDVKRNSLRTITIRWS